MSVPAVAAPGPVLVIARSANRWTVVIAVAMLFAPLVSSPALVAVTVAVLVSVPVVVGAMCAPMLNVRLAPAASVLNVHVTTFGAVWLHPEEAPANVVPAGSVSVTVPPLDAEGPLLVTDTAEVISLHAVAVAGPVLVIDRSANRWTVVVAVAVLFAPLVSSLALVAVTVAVFVSVPVVVGAMCAPMLIVRLAPAASVPLLPFTTFFRSWLHPEEAPANVVPAGSVSVTVPPLDAEGP